ncbi:MAG: hypothetical protein ACPG47_00115 [Leucothrix sp.]
MSTAPLKLNRDVTGAETYFIPLPIRQKNGVEEQAYQFILSADVEVTLTVPLWATQAKMAFSEGTGVWVKESGSPIVWPLTGVPVAQNIERNPSGRNVTPGATLRFICADPSEVNVVFYP